MAMYMINAGKLAACPKIKITFGDIHVEVILDTGSQVSVLSDDIFRQLKLQGSIMELPVQSVVLMSAFGNKTSRVKRQAMISFTINGDEFENNFLISPQLVSPGILGADFLYEYKLSIDLGSGHITRVTPSEGTGVRKYELIYNLGLNKMDKVTALKEESQGEFLKVKTITCDGRVLLQPSLVRTPSLGFRKNRCCDFAREKEFMDEPGCCDEEKHEEEEEESYDKAPVNDADDDNYADEDYDNDDDEDVHPGRRLGEPREPNVQNTDDVINEAVKTAHLRSAEQREEVRAILRRYQKSFSSTPGLCVDFEY